MPNQSGQQNRTGFAGKYQANIAEISGQIIKTDNKDQNIKTADLASE